MAPGGVAEPAPDRDPRQLLRQLGQRQEAWRPDRHEGRHPGQAEDEEKRMVRGQAPHPEERRSRPPARPQARPLNSGPAQLVFLGAFGDLADPANTATHFNKFVTGNSLDIEFDVNLSTGIISGGKFSASIDSGGGFDYNASSHASSDDSFGRGVDILRELCDSVTYSDGGSCITVTYSIGSRER